MRPGMPDLQCAGQALICPHPVSQEDDAPLHQDGAKGIRPEVKS